ncbi:MAG: EAL domain-containing protein [Pseudomonadota bacterium]
MKPREWTSTQVVIGLVVAIILALLYYYYQSMMTGPTLRKRVVYNFSAIENMELQIDAQVVKLRSRLQNNYDPLVIASKDVRLRLEELKNGESAIYLHGDERIDELLRELELAVERKENLIEDFKSHNSVLKNSLFYLPRTVEQTIQLAPADKELKENLHDLLRSVLMVHMGDNSYDVKEQIARLSRAAHTPAVRGSLERTIKHANYVTQYGREVDMLVTQITGQDTHRLVGELAAAYEQAFDKSIKIANFYRFSISLVALWLLAYATYSFLRLRESSEKLNEAYVERSQAEARERTRNHVLELLARNISLPEILDPIVRGIEAQNLGMICSIMLLDEEGQNLQLCVGPSLPEVYRAATYAIPVAEQRCLCCSAVFRGERIVSESGGLPCAPNCALAMQDGITACWAEPIKSASAKALGVLVVYYREGRKPNEGDASVIENAANLASIAIERKQLDENLQLAALVYQNSSEGMVITDSRNRILAVNSAYIQITGYTLDEVIGKDPKIFASGRHDSAFFVAMWRELKTAGKWQGEIWDKRKSGEDYAKWVTINTILNIEGTVHRYLALFSDITERKKSDELIWSQANYDILTGLPNRRMFQDRLEQEIKRTHRAQLQLALLLIDLDQFKEVNDTLGHAAGDTLLQAAAGRVSACVRDTDTVARLGGDEFTVILSQLNDVRQVESISKNILMQLAKPFHIEGEAVYVSASIGITIYPGDAREMEHLIKNADQAMYVSKNQGRNRSSYFTPLLQEIAQNKLRMISDLRNALDGTQFLLYYQPIVDLTNGEITKAEALVRWLQPQRGLIEPMEFISLAEETGLINEIGNWVFREAARQVKYLRTTYSEEFQISVNKSPVQFRDSGRQYNAGWLSYLEELELPGRSMVIEVTEGLLLNAESNITDKLLKYRDAGIQVAIDDFGTGYSSLAYLKKFDIDYLKIDQVFVHNLENDPDNLALCEAIIVMAHKLELKVIAEGVESIAQRDLLAAVGCDYAQGFFFSRPLPADEFKKLLHSWKV